MYFAGDSGEEGTYLEDIINAAVTADERPGQSMYAIKSNGSVWAREITHTINLQRFK